MAPPPPPNKFGPSINVRAAVGTALRASSLTTEALNPKYKPLKKTHPKKIWQKEGLELYCINFQTKKQTLEKKNPGKKTYDNNGYCGGHWSFPTFSINFAAPHFGFRFSRFWCKA